MTDYKYKYSQILSLVEEAKNKKILSDSESDKIDEYIISYEPDLTLEEQNYNKEKDLTKLIYTLKVVCGIESYSTPLDEQMLKRKHKKGPKGPKGSKGPEKNSETENDTKPDKPLFEPIDTEFGESPKFNPKPLPKRKHKA